ncbi:MAG: type II secretion system F family protein [Rhodospirillales bacterium]|nr:type II secretion system F family protein [Rhodospirillales bacterium]
MGKSALNRYNYKGYKIRTGKFVSGIIAAGSELEVVEILKQYEIEIIDCKREKEGVWVFMRLFNNKFSLVELLSFYTLMKQLLKSGIPLVQSLEKIFEHVGNTVIGDVSVSLRTKIGNGLSLSEAMKEHPKIFPELDVALVMAAEETGDLASVFEQLSEKVEWLIALRRNIRKALVYPVIVLFLAVAFIVVMMGYTVPQIVGFLKSQDMELPLYTTALISTSEFVHSYWWVILGGVVVTVLSVVGLYRASESFRYRIDQLSLGIPGVGDFLRKVDVARFVYTLATLYKREFHLLDGVMVSSRVVRNSVIKGAIETAAMNLRDGDELSYAFAKTGEFSHITICMLGVGAESGRLDETLTQLSNIYDKDVEDAVENLIAMIEPAMTVVLGGMILWVAVAVFGPVYASFENIEF